MTFETDQIRFLQGTRDRVKMIGMDHVVTLLLIALVSRGHVLLEGNPGLGKTQLVKRLRSALDLGEEAFGRIQFTPDLMPSDVTGTRLPQDGGLLKFEPGPVFHELLLADEINRATPKTQSAMLEAMAEFQVTVLGESHALTEVETVTVDGRSRKVRTPFMVMATQNPVEQEGTYALPEAQLDRFLFKIRMPFPVRDDLAKIVGMMFDDELSEKAETRPDDNIEARHRALRQIDLVHGALHRIEPAAPVRAHILNLVLASCGDFEGLQGLSKEGAAALKDFVAKHVDYPLGPRAAKALTQAAIGWAAAVETGADTPDDVAAHTPIGLAATAVPVLRHRLRFREDFDAQDYAEETMGEAAADRHDDLIREFARLSAPDTDGYARLIAQALDSARGTVRV